MCDFLYRPYDTEKSAFGSNWVFTGTYEHCKEVLIALYRSNDDDDGQSVEVYGVAAPARFYILKVLEGENSVGDEQPAYTISTGSGEADTAAVLARKISEGMLSFKPNKPRDVTNIDNDLYDEYYAETNKGEE